ncbi:hypothetical protein [Haloarchaeobius litoreus]|uniref:DUF7981 domain-containing protein n=1 Tax=Haloarchaeobius litoreus TaxID=755306 RepID=A0ABD6DPA5_9EURY|nr:hypothetical protein [Haloarchaeobius litoreus]
MNERTKSALLWGAVGVFAFLTLHQGYVALGGESIGILPAVGLGFVVGTVVAAAAYVGEVRLLRRGR